MRGAQLEPRECFDGCLIGWARRGDRLIAIYDYRRCSYAWAEWQGIAIDEAAHWLQQQTFSLTGEDAPLLVALLPDTLNPQAQPAPVQLPPL